jgi:hypothetical protein
VSSGFLLLSPIKAFSFSKSAFTLFSKAALLKSLSSAKLLSSDNSWSPDPSDSTFFSSSPLELFFSFFISFSLAAFLSSCASILIS